MNGLPLHPMVVHLPLALAGLAPVLALVALGVHLARRPSRGLFLALALLQLVLAAGAVVALKTGEQEEERVERVVGEARIHEHEEAAETFVTAAWIAFAIGLVPLVWGSRRPVATTGALATLLAVAVVLALGVRVGEAGAALVYRHGAAAPYVAGASAATPAADTSAGGHGVEDDD